MSEERFIARISGAELSRRWRAIEAELDARGLDGLLAQSAQDWVGGAVRYLTDRPATNGYPCTVILHKGIGLSVIEMGPFGTVRQYDGTDIVQRGVREIRTVPAFSSVGYTNGYDGQVAAEILRSRGARRIGIVTPGAMPSGFLHTLLAGLEGNCQTEEATDWFDEIKAVKSEEEIGLIRRAAALQDKVFAHVLKIIRPGLRDIDVMAAAQSRALKLGSEQGILLGGSSPQGRASVFLPRQLQGRRLRDGDHLSLLIEVNGPGGFYTEIARTIVLGRAGNEIRDGFEAVREAQSHTLGLLKPGVPAREIAAVHDRYMHARGLPPELRLYSHGQGYDMVERPLLRVDETMTLKAGMNLAVHPSYETPSLYAVICDNYLLGEAGPGQCLHGTEKRVFEV